MEIATGPLSSLLPKLAKLLQDEYKLHKGARKGIEFLHKELETMHAVLRKVGEVPREQLDELQMIWAREVRELSYDMEDIVDTFLVEVEGPDPPSKRGAKKIFDKMIRKANKAMARREVAQDINDIKGRAKELADRRDRYKVDNIAPAKKIPVDPRLKALYTDATEIVGIEEAKEEVITMLREGDDDQKKRIIVSIAGFGGLGKTTLAKAVYNEIKKDFVCTAFVSVSRNPDPKKLLNDMLYELNEEAHQGANLDDIKHLIDRVRKWLWNKRYLIIIDDIWDKEPWDKVIALSLIENNMRSRIIITTRIIDVAEHVGGCYRLKPLSDKSSEMLFYGRIFGSQDKCPNQFSEVSKIILKKCGGVPLAIVTTSSLLANKSENIKVWENVCDSIGLGLGRNNPGMDDMRKILLLSYYDLPSHLRTCLLYLSVFPEDYEISKDTLIWRWVAEGFVQQGQQAGRDQISFLEIGESYFNDLLNRSLIQPAGMDGEEGMPKACRVHDTVLDLIITLSVEECFITTVLGDGMQSNVRRLSLHSSNTTWPTMKMPKLRSLTIFRLDDNVVIDPTLSRYLLLRVLDLQGCRLKGLASLWCLGSLSHLRYLGVSTCSFLSATDQLPAELGKLQFLQTLDIYNTTVVQVPSSVIAGLGQLICLRGASIYTNLPVGLKYLTSLEVLEWAVVESERMAEELGHLTKLRTLDVKITKECGKSLVESLGKLAKIESLNIILSPTNNLDGPMEKPLGNMCRLRIHSAMFLPTWINPASLPSLSWLDITVDYERRRDIQVLGTLPCLRHIRFKVLHATKQQEEAPLERCVVGPDAFPRAVRCNFDTYTGVVPSMFPRGAMPMLQDLTFRMEQKQFWRSGCISVDDVGLGHLPSLRKVAALGLDHFDLEVMRSVGEKLVHEVAVHPNHPIILLCEGYRVRYVGPTKPPSLPQRGPSYGYRGRVMLAFEDGGFSKIGVRFDKKIPDGNDLGGLCEEDHGFFCPAELLRPDFSTGEEVERLAMTELIEDISEEKNLDL